MRVSWFKYFIYIYTADPYVAAMEFLEANGLPDMYLDQVAEFIVQNAGEYLGPIDSGPVDPFTGWCMYCYTYGPIFRPLLIISCRRWALHSRAGQSTMCPVLCWWT